MGRKAKKKPKCRRSAYIYFVKEYQRHLRRKKGTLPFGETSRLCAVKWKHLSEAAKDKYRSLSRADADRYRTEMKALTRKEKKELKKKKDPRAPVKPLSAYMWFCKNNRKAVAEQHPEMSHREVTRELGRLWVAQGDEERKSYERMANYDKKFYRVEMAKYRSAKSADRKKCPP